MSDFSTFCSVLSEDLLDNVPTLVVDSNNVHLLAPWSPEELLNDGSAHLAIWPAAEAGEAAAPLMLGADDVLQTYRLIYWESATTESSRGVTDTEAAGNLLDLANAVRSRLYRATLAASGFWKIRYRGMQLPERSSDVRWFLMECQAWTAIAFT